MRTATVTPTATPTVVPTSDTYKTRKGENCDAFLLKGRPTSRQSFWSFYPNLYCPFAETAVFELFVKILTSLLYLFIRNHGNTEQTYTQTVKKSLHKKDRKYVRTITKTPEDDF